MTSNYLDGIGVMDVKVDYYSVGWDAAVVGKGVLDCPVVLVSGEGQDWLAGWMNQVEAAMMEEFPKDTQSHN